MDMLHVNNLQIFNGNRGCQISFFPYSDWLFLSMMPETHECTQQMTQEQTIMF